MIKLASKKCHFIYPHQIFEEIFNFSKDVMLIIIEDPLFFGDKEYSSNFHKQKIVLHRASLRSFKDVLIAKGFTVKYFDYALYPDPKYVAGFLNKINVLECTVFDPVDHILEKRLKKYLTAPVSLQILESPNFLTPAPILNAYFAGKKKFLMSSFYSFQRKRLDVLMDGDRPRGGKWSFDKENRKKLPKELIVPVSITLKRNDYVSEAICYVNKYFKDNPGEVNTFNYPIDHAEAKKVLADFVKNRLYFFGKYEDAISKNESTLFHSKLSAPLNIGLLSPSQIVNLVLSVEDTVPLSSLEGFLRQIIGWREFMRAVYVIMGPQMRKLNHLNHTNKLPDSWYKGTTGIEPVDQTIKKVLLFAYCHHIERLMIIGNFMLLLKIDPNQVYQWFMDLFIDSYDWVMVPNVYAMSQFSDGGTITTKPYFSSSNYILKMSDYGSGDWCKIWDDLFYNFLNDHRSVIAKNPRLSILLKNLDKIPKERLSIIKKTINKYL
jgi:deoxyribodipyrimidine photolyase-related protein